MRRLKSIPPCGLQNVPYAGMKKKIPNIISNILKIILDILSIEYYNLAKDTINVQKMLYQIMKMDGGEFMSSKKTGKISLLLVIAMMISLFSGCSQGGQGASSEAPAGGQGSSQAEAPAEKVKLSFWSGFSGTDRSFQEEIVDKFNQQSSDCEIEISIMGWDILDEKMVASFASGSGPDFFTSLTAPLAKYYEMGALADVSAAYADGIVDKSIYPESAVSLPEFDGAYYGFPMTVLATGLYYNIDMLEAAGYSEPPKTQDELWEYAKKLTIIENGEVKQYGFAVNHEYVFTSLMWGQGLRVIGRDNMTATINTPETVQFVDKIAKLIKDDKICTGVTDDNENQALFTSGKLAMVLYGPAWGTTFEEAGLNFGMTTMPAGPEGSESYGFPILHAASATIGDNISHFYEWQNFWSTRDMQVIWAKGSGFTPIRTDMADDEELADSYCNKFAGEIGMSNYLTLPAATQIQDVVKTTWEEIILSDDSTQDVLDRAADELNSLL